MQKRDKVIAILCSDIHLSAKPPRARRKEACWFDAMAYTLTQMRALSERYTAPILCAGDLFDHWRAEPELINFAINYLPEMYAIPGQHDLPLHNIDLIKRSAFWTMVLVGRVTPVHFGKPLIAENNLVIHGFPWDTTIAPFEGESKKHHVAICHQYFWTNHHHFPGAPKEREAKVYRNKIKGYHAVAFGDNHKGFLTKINDTFVLNCGGFTRRKSDEENYEPQVGLLCRSGRIIIHKFKTSHEKFITLAEEEEGLRKMLRVNDMGDFLVGLSELQQQSFDFVEALNYAMEKKSVSNNIRRLILQALGREE